MADHTTPPHRHPPRNRIRTALAALAGTALAAASISVVTLTTTATPARAAGLSPFDIAGRGATVPFIEHEAENAAHNGTRIGPDRRYGTL
ncbi:hypothetical protein AB0M52_30825, partial [Micromonospora sp. NPDC051296]